MKKNSKIVALILVLALALTFSVGCAKDKSESDSDAKETSIFRTLDEIKDSGKIVIGVFSDKAPFGYIDADGDYQGYDVELANRIGKDLGVDVEYVSLDPASRVEYLETGKVDIVLANFTVTDERAKSVDFANPYMKVQLGVVSPESAPIDDIKDLDGKKFILVKGTTAETYFTENENGAELIKFDAYEDAYNALLDGRGDAFSTDNTEVLAWAKENAGFTVGIDALGDIDAIAPAVSKGNTTLLDWLNDELTKLGSELFFHAAYEKTLAPVYGTDADPDSLVVEGVPLS
ncbi:MAG: cysteine ABC transporter substrate-binding protein [Clostridiales Family XIII bacterium]|nr:cysteine ABC transporter substrate-binding protein [Clostridiales Family XIII bacterium]